MFIETHKGKAWGSDDKALGDAANCVKKYEDSAELVEFASTARYVFLLLAVLCIPLLHLLGAGWTTIVWLSAVLAIPSAISLWYTRPKHPRNARYNIAVATINSALENGRALLRTGRDGRPWRLLNAAFCLLSDVDLVMLLLEGENCASYNAIVAEYANSVAVAIKAAREDKKPDKELRADIVGMAKMSALKLAVVYNDFYTINLPDSDGTDLTAE